MRIWLALLAFTLFAPAQAMDWAAADAETLKHFQALVRMDTSDPPGNEVPAVEYLKQVLEAEGFEVKVFTKWPRRPNLVVRLKGSGKKRPVLMMAHTDTVNVDPKKWVNHGPFSADLAGGHIYGRGTVDDKDNLTASLMAMLLLKRSGVKLDRDVIFLAESGEEGNTRVGIKFMVEEHWPEIEAEFCLAEGGVVSLQGGRLVSMNVATAEKVPTRTILKALGTAGHGSVPLADNAIARLSAAVAKAAAWRTPMKLNDTTRAYFERLATVSTPEQAARYNRLSDPEQSAGIQEYLRLHEPRHYSMLRTSISPTIIQAGYRMNIIPSEGEATLDIRAVPDEDYDAFYAALKKEIGDDSIEIERMLMERQPGKPSPLDTEMFKMLERQQKRHYPQAITLPSMLTGATDMAFLRERGVACYGIGPAIDVEDGPQGYGSHSDRERILEKELYRFVKFNYEAVREIAAAP
ncbi:MAG: M20/M25/M40 family metallo-hydrolase [Bryobacterales bacterium]|nr:M20/M25/M40 family metallo-hydrolase [Bryobacterales bacterium]